MTGAGGANPQATESAELSHSGGADRHAAAHRRGRCRDRCREGAAAGHGASFLLHPAAEATSLDRAECRRNVAYATQLCRHAANSVFEAAGASNVYESSDLQRLWRDSNVASMHHGSCGTCTASHTDARWWVCHPRGKRESRARKAKPGFQGLRRCLTGPGFMVSLTKVTPRSIRQASERTGGEFLQSSLCQVRL